MGNQQYKSQGKKSLFDQEFATEKLSEIGNPLDMISNVIDFEMFRNFVSPRATTCFYLPKFIGSN